MMREHEQSFTDENCDARRSYLDLLKAYLETAERNIDRRGETNRFFQAVFSGLIGVLVVASSGKLDFIIASNGDINLPVVATLSAFTGIMGWFWAGQLESHRELSEAKYAVITEIEDYLGIKIYTRENRYFEEQKWKYTMTNRELLPPRMLMIAGFSSLAYSIFAIGKALL